MAHKKKIDQDPEPNPYTIQDAMSITDDILKLSKENKYHPGAFIHGLIFTLEYTQSMFNIPQQQLATIKRDCRKYIKEIDNARTRK